MCSNGGYTERGILAVGRRRFWEPETVWVIGAGPIGLLAALLGCQRGFDVHVLDRVTGGPKPELVRALGAAYDTGSIADPGLQPHIVIECAGAPQLILQALGTAPPAASSASPEWDHRWPLPPRGASPWPRGSR